MAWVKDEGNARRFELLGVLQHGVAAIGRNNAKFGVCVRHNLRHMRLHHRARVEGGDLVVVMVRHDHRLRGVGVTHHTHKFGAHAQILDALGIVRPVAANGGHDQGCAAQLFECIGDIARTAAKLAAQCRDEEGDVEVM